MPLFLLMGGELVIAYLMARIGLWILRGRYTEETPVPPYLSSRQATRSI